MPTPPASLRADQMLFMVHPKPYDSDNNGYPDVIHTEVALFSRDHPTSIREQGTFVFMLFSQGTSSNVPSDPIAQWRLGTDAVHDAQSQSYLGPSYIFSLSLIAAGGDRMPANRADILCRFEPADGSTPFESEGVRTVQIGGRLGLP